MAHVDTLSLDAKIGLARKAVISAAYDWRTKTDHREWTTACENLVKVIDHLSTLMRERHPPSDPMRSAPLGPDSWQL